jgi:hypothetical protein
VHFRGLQIAAAACHQQTYYKVQVFFSWSRRLHLAAAAHTAPTVKPVNVYSKRRMAELR